MADDPAGTFGHTDNTWTRHRLTLQPPRDKATAARMDQMRENIIVLGEYIEQHCPHSRERSLALTKLEECCSWAIGAIARNQDGA